MILSKQFWEIEKHLAKYFNKNKEIIVFHEKESDDIHLDIYLIKPNKQRDYIILMSNGISGKPFKTPDKNISGFIELCILLPKNWDIDNWKESRNYWPIELIKDIGRYPSVYDTWLGYGHTIGFGDTFQKYNTIGNTQFVGSILLKSISLPINFQEIKFGSFLNKKTIELYLIYPLYQEELDFAKNNGSDKLVELFDKNKLKDVLNINRENVCKILK